MFGSLKREIKLLKEKCSKLQYDVLESEERYLIFLKTQAMKIKADEVYIKWLHDYRKTDNIGGLPEAKIPGVAPNSVLEIFKGTYGHDMSGTPDDVRYVKVIVNKE